MTLKRFLRVVLCIYASSFLLNERLLKASYLILQGVGPALVDEMLQSL